MGVYGEPTHTNKYLDFESYNPAQSKRAVVKTLMDRAKYLPSTSERKQSQKQQLISDLKNNGYPKVSSNAALINPYKQTARKSREREGLRINPFCADLRLRASWFKQTRGKGT